MSSLCALCDTKEPLPIWFRDEVPVTQATIYDDAQFAKNVTHSKLSIVICEVCGFAWNEAFETDLVPYDITYVGTQAASATFSSILLDQVRYVIVKSSLSERGSVVELGAAGKGKFLCALNEIYGAQCLGFDPVYRKAPLPERVRIERCVMPEDYEHDFDLFVCRITLEHLDRPNSVLK